MLSRLTMPLILVAVLVGAVHAADASAATPRCFGAAARDSRSSCANASQRLSVSPTPAVARTLPNSPCTAIRGQIHPPVCSFGVTPAEATATVALVGDSHAGHWRGALSEVARVKGWRGLSITHTSCPLQQALRDLPEPRRSQCADWKRDVFAWFAMHPEIHTVFVAGLSGGTSVVPTRGRDRFATSVAGYVDAWRALPASVEHIVVIRDTPKLGGDTDTCIERAMSRRENAGLACAVRRSRALDRDPAIAAASRMPADRVQTVDLTRLFCGSRDCYPVIGGALVLRDTTHMTGVFSATLGPYLLRDLDHALTRFRDADGRS
jgi:hypothetical protein